ncbi:hypothetical protein OC834_004676 [Tilletia horrida]|nr:hypothetical protein OC834_004676 [Tilletia horrida]
MEHVSVLLLPLLGLPIELLKHLLEFVPHRDLPACCRVSKLFHTLAAPILYRRLWLRDQIRLHKVFKVLAGAPHLASLLRVVEVRVFPFGLPAEQLEALEIAIIKTFQNANNLEELIWTRTGSFMPRTGFQRSRNDRVLRTVFDKTPKLKLLELTGDSRSWSPDLLIAKMPPVIERFSIIMPDRPVTERIPDIANRLGANLQSLSVLSNNAAFIRDAYIEAAAPFLTSLTRLSLVGCKNVTGSAVLAILKQNPSRIVELSLEGLSLVPAEIDRIAQLSIKVKTLAITHPAKASPEFYDSLASWIENSHQLRRLTFYRMSGEVAAPDEEQTASDDEEEGADQPESLPPDAAPGAPHIAASAEASSSTLPTTTPASDSPHLERFRNQPYRPQPPTGTVPASRSRGGAPSDPLLSSTFLQRVLAARGAELVQLRIHRLAMTIEQLGLICHSCPQLEDLVVHLYEPESEIIKAHLSALPRLRSVHILASLRSGLEMSEANLRDVAASASTTLRQIGFRNRVWEVIPNLEDTSMARQSATQTNMIQCIVNLYNPILYFN